MNKKTNIMEVAKRAGVSKSTVSRVLNNSYGISEEAREKVLTAVEELKYRPNISARALRSNTHNLLGILISQQRGDESITHLVNSSKIRGIVKKVREFGYDVLIFIEDITDHVRLRDIIREKGLTGVILLDEVPVEVLESFRHYSIPYILVNWFAPGYCHQCYVKTNLASGVVKALDLLLAKGYTQIGVINWEDRHMKEPVIENAFCSYMKEKGLEYRGCVWNTKNLAEMQEVVGFLEKTKKRAYISFSYFTSMKILEYCREREISIPGELALISYEFFPFYDYLHPRLTGIRQPAELMGERATEKLIKHISDGIPMVSELLEPELVIRESC